MFKLLALVAIFAALAGAYPAPEEDQVQAVQAAPLNGQAAVANKDLQADLEGGEAAEGSDLKGSETFGFGYYPTYRNYYGGYGGYGGWGYGGGWGGYRGGWGGWGHPRYYYW